MTGGLVEVRVEDEVGRLIMNRPEARNALSLEMIESLHDSIDQIRNDRSIRVVVMEGAGRAFCAGMDLKGVMDDPEKMGDMLRTLARVTLEIRSISVPTIARVQGAAIGGGCGLSGVCDFVVSHPEVKIGYPEISLGICPAVVATWLMLRIGAGNARTALLTGGLLPAEQAFDLGLIDRLVPEAELDDEIQGLVRKISAGGPQAIMTTKKWLNELDGAEIEAQVLKGAELSAEVIRGPEAQERLRKVFAK
ncbi:MAG: enoyl-CoA hydratase/isomerase family protein [Planctomycetota bacterium]|nr:enoyl-CoA hydratase/isomerase family protein [Planctomycetota bacterium]